MITVVAITIAVAVALIITTIAVCAVRRASQYDRWLEERNAMMVWPAQGGPYYCEGPLYERQHCSEAGLFQCPDCRKEQQLNGRPQ